MRHATTIVALLICLVVPACVDNKDLNPPDSVMDPRGQ
jgi:hypothetical protein